MNLKKRLEDKLEEIADFLLNQEDDNTEIGALTGISGNALFHFYYGNYKDDDRHREKGAEIISETFNRIEEGYTYPTFCDGIAGACWVLELLKEEQFIELEEDIFTEDLDKYLFEKMNEFISNNNFDFLHGAIGIGFYYLKRFENVTSSKLRRRYEEYLNVLLIEISDKGIRNNNMISWESEIKSGKYKTEGCNLGLAHGIPNIINFLSRLIKHPSFYSQTLQLIKPACNYVLSCKHVNPKLSSSFPNWIVNNKPNNYNSRLAWCYGDLGIGISILKAGKSINDQTLVNESLQILKKTTYRQDMTEARIKDGGICHGAFGVMHIYKYLYEETNDSLFIESTKSWNKHGLDLAIHKDGYAGYKEYSPIEGAEWKSCENLLGGVSGIGLTILHNLSPSTSSKWSEALLIK